MVQANFLRVRQQHLGRQGACPLAWALCRNLARALCQNPDHPHHQLPPGAQPSGDQNLQKIEISETTFATRWRSETSPNDAARRVKLENNIFATPTSRKVLEFGQFNPQKIFFLRSYFYTLVVILSSGNSEIPLPLTLLYRFWHLHGQGNFYAEGIFQKNIFQYSKNIFEKIFFSKSGPKNEKYCNTENCHQLVTYQPGDQRASPMGAGGRLVDATKRQNQSKLNRAFPKINRNKKQFSVHRTKNSPCPVDCLSAAQNPKTAFHVGQKSSTVTPTFRQT